MRISNLQSLALGKNMGKQGGRYWIMFKSDDTKNNRQIHYDPPSALTSAFDSYVATSRSILLSAGGTISPIEIDALWISSEGAPMSERWLHQTIKNRTRRKFGVGEAPHRFRDGAVTDVSEKDPSHMLAAPLVIGDSPKTIMRHYNQSRGRLAHARYHAAIDDIRGPKREK